MTFVVPLAITTLPCCFFTCAEIADANIAIMAKLNAGTTIILLLHDFHGLSVCRLDDVKTFLQSVKLLAVGRIYL